MNMFLCKCSYGWMNSAYVILPSDFSFKIRDYFLECFLTICYGLILLFFFFTDAIASDDNIRITPSLRSKKGKNEKMY